MRRFSFKNGIQCVCVPMCPLELVFLDDFIKCKQFYLQYIDKINYYLTLTYIAS